MRIELALAAFGFLISVAAAGADSDLRTVAESSDYRRTGRYDEVLRLCSAYERAWPKQARCFEFGRTPEGRAMMALAVSADGTLDAASVRSRSRPVLLMQGGIHAGEIDGKDAGFRALRDLLEGRVGAGTLQAATVVFVPVFNVDGHERFGANNRPNQIGPEEMGWRTTAQNLNLNRDYVKAEAPEMQAMLRLLNDWDPLVYVDLHVTDGAEFEHDISIGVAPSVAGDAELRKVGLALRDAVLGELKSKGSLPLEFYPSFLRNDDPQSGFSVAPSPPRFSHEYWGRRNRIGVLVETHSWKPYKQRVQATYNTIIALGSQVAEHGAEWTKVVADLDRRSRMLGGAEVPLAYDVTDHVTTIEFRGYRYTRTQSPISGATMTRYDARTPEIWRVPLFDEVRASAVATAPRGGYLVPSAWADRVAPKLALHKVRYSRIPANETLSVQTFRANDVRFGVATNEGRTTLNVVGRWQDETRLVPAGSLFVPIAQTNASLAMVLFEPASPDSLLSWGYFNAAFERKEYMEAYVAEQVAERMLEQDAVLKGEFERRLKEDPAFASNPQSRLEFFYRRHPSFDERLNLYPVYRVEAPPALR